MLIPFVIPAATIEWVCLGLMPVAWGGHETDRHPPDTRPGRPKYGSGLNWSGFV